MNNTDKLKPFLRWAKSYFKHNVEMYWVPETEEFKLDNIDAAYRGYIARDQQIAELTKQCDELLKKGCYVITQREFAAIRDQFSDCEGMLGQADDAVDAVWQNRIDIINNLIKIKQNRTLSTQEANK